MTKVELINQILDDWVDTKRSFSHHDVVAEMRKRANAKLVKLTDVVYSIFDNADEARAELFYDRSLRDSVMSEVRKRDHITLTNSSGYIVYQLKASAKFVPMIFSKDRRTVKNSNSPILDYVNRKIKSGEPVTVKMVQSALKRGRNYKSISSKEIRDTLTTHGYHVQTGPNRSAKISK